MATPQEKAENVQKVNDLIQKQITNLKGVNAEEDRRRLVSEQISNYQRVINEMQKEHIQNGVDNLTQQEQLRKKQEELIAGERTHNELLEKGIKGRQRQVDLAKQLVGQLKLGWKYLQDADKIIKSTNLSLGMSSSKAAAMRDAFEQSAGYVTRLGGTIADIGTVMQGYADETGRARVMTASMVKDITDIGKGTGLGIAEATRLGAQFELMGYNAKGMVDYVQGVVDTSERMGVNTTKVLKTVNDNFKRLNTYTFQQGVKGFAEMAMYAEKFKIDINQALNAADVARTLEGAIDLTAQLQVMGGEFAKTDPFEMLFLARNDPAKFTEKIADMTKGLVSFRKMADGSFEKFISPADRDRIAAVAKSMGMEASALTEIAERQAEVQKMRNQMAGTGLSAEQKKIVEGAAQWNKETGKFQVQLGNSMINIGELTKTQAKSFEQEQVLLKDRAKEAMTFDETLKAMIETLKAALLPLLNTINVVLKPVAKIADGFSKLAGKGAWGIAAAASTLLIGATAWKVGVASFGKLMGKWVQTGGFKGALGSAMGGGGKGAGSGAFKGIAPGEIGSDFTQTGQIRKGAAGLHQAKGTASLKRGLGSGAAMAGAGAGIAIAAVGISKLADSMSKLTPEQADSLEKIAITLAVTFPLAALGIAAVGGVATASAVGLLALGGAMLLIGGGIFLATKGIGDMATGLAKLNDSGGGAGAKLTGVAGGITAIMLAMGAGGLPMLFAFNNSLRRMAKSSDGIEKIGVAFSHITAALSGSKEDFMAVEQAVKSIGSSNVRGGGYFAELSALLSKPLQVEFAKGKVSMTNDITLNMDGQKFMQKSYDVNIAIQKHESVKHAKGGLT